MKSVLVFLIAISSTSFLASSLHGQPSSSEKLKHEEKVETEYYSHKNPQAMQEHSPKPRFGLMVGFVRLGNTATSVGTEFGPYHGNIPGNMAYAGNFDLNLRSGVYGFKKTEFARFTSNLRSFVLGGGHYPGMGLTHVNDTPTYQEAANDPLTKIRSVGIGAEFTVGRQNGSVYQVAPSIGLLGGARTLRLNITNSFFRKK